MGNYLKMSLQQQIETLLELGWAHRRIGRELGVHRETVSRCARLRDSKPANPIAGSEDPGPRDGPDQNRPNPITGLEGAQEGQAQNRPNPITGPPSSAAAHHEYIEKGLKRGLTAQRIWQDLVEQHGYSHGYLTVQRYARRLKRQRAQLADRMEHPAGDEAQIDFIKSKAPVGDPGTGRRTYSWVFRMTVSCSRHGYEEALPHQKAATFMRAHEHAFLQFGGVPRGHPHGQHQDRGDPGLLLGRRPQRALRGVRRALGLHSVALTAASPTGAGHPRTQRRPRQRSRAQGPQLKQYSRTTS